MLPEGENVYISKDSSYWEEWTYESEKKTYLSISPSEVADLYNVFRENHFDLIGVNEEQEVYDRGGTSVDITVDGKYFDKSSSGMSFIAEQDWDEYANVESAILKLVHEKLDEKRQFTRIVLSDSLLNSGYLIQLSVEQKLVYDSKVDSLRNSDIEMRLLPGENLFEIYLMYRDSLNQYGSNAIFYNENYVGDIDVGRNRVKFDFVDGELRIE